MKIKKSVLDRFDAGILSVSMEGCDQIHYDEVYNHLLKKDKTQADADNLLWYKFYHKTLDGKDVLAWMHPPQNKNCIHYSQIWEQGEESPDIDIELEGAFYVFLPGKQTPQVQYTLQSEATKEAERLCKKEKQIAYVCEVRVIVEPSDEVKITYR